MPRRLLFLLLGLSILAGCDRYPQDPDHTLEQIIARGAVRVGIIAHPPWVIGSAPGAPRGIEATLVEEWAAAQGVTAEWHWGSEQSHIEALRDRRLDVVIGGLVKANPWKKHAGFTAPWYTHEVVIGVPPGVAHPDQLEGLEVVVAPDAPWRTTLEEEEARLTEARPDGSRIAAVRSWELAPLGLEPSELRFSETSQVMAVPLGENALLMSLEDHLLKADPRRIEQALREGNR